MSLSPEEQWYYLDAGQNFGPISLDKLRAKIHDLSGKCTIEMVRSEKMERWLPVDQVEQLKISQAPQRNLPATPIRPSGPKSEAKAAIEKAEEQAWAEREAKLKAAAQIRARAKAMREALLIQNSQPEIAAQEEPDLSAKPNTDIADAKTRELTEEEIIEAELDAEEAEAEVKRQAVVAAIRAEQAQRKANLERIAAEKAQLASLEAAKNENEHDLSQPLQPKIEEPISLAGEPQLNTQPEKNADSSSLAIEELRVEKAAAKALADAKLRSEALLQRQKVDEVKSTNLPDAKQANGAAQTSRIDTSEAEVGNKSAENKVMGWEEIRRKVEEDRIKSKAAAMRKAHEKEPLTPQQASPPVTSQAASFVTKELEPKADGFVAAKPLQDEKSLDKTQTRIEEQARLLAFARAEAYLKKNAMDSAVASVPDSAQLDEDKDQAAPLIVTEEKPKSKVVPPASNLQETSIEKEVAVLERKLRRKRMHASLTSKNSWYYKVGGDRQGPVCFEELQELAAEGKLNSDDDLVWKKGMIEWLPAAKIEGFQDRTIMDEANRIQNGITRGGFLSVVVFPIIWFAVLAVITPMMIHMLGIDLWLIIDKFRWVVPGFVITGLVLLRLKNLGMSGLWVIGLLVPILNLWIGYRCFFCPENYVLNPKLTGSVKGFSVVYWLIAPIFMILSYLMIATSYSLLDDSMLTNPIVKILIDFSHR